MRCSGQWLCAAATLLVWSPAWGVPALDAPFPLSQPDGTSFWARSWGDERTAGVETLDGYTIVRASTTGVWVYAGIDAGGLLAQTALVVGRDAPSGPRRVRPAPPLPWLAPGLAPVPDGAPPVLGTHRLLILLVDFTPTQSRGTTEADWHAHAFSGGSATAPQSVAEYWSEVSYGRIALGPAAESRGGQNDGVVEVTLPYAHPNPSGDDANRQITSDAIVLADPYVDYAGFDDNSDGYLSSDELHLLVVARGYEGAYGGASGTCSGAGAVWAHHWSLYGSVPAPIVDGVVVGSTFGAPLPGPFQGGYNQIGEFHCSIWDSPGHQATIGVATHELGHDMGTGVPDLYDTDGSSNGIGRWALQAGGSWNTTGAYIGMTPAWPDAWSRSFFGILTPARPGCVNNHAFPQIETASGGPDHGVVQIGDNPGGVDWEWGGLGSGEYFLVENRQWVGFDAGLPTSGLLIWHIAENVFGDNSANASEGTCPPGNRRLVALEQADGDFDLECFSSCGGVCNTGDSGDPWRVGMATTFDDSSTPSSRLYSGAGTGLGVTDISASGAVMTADLSGAGTCDDGDACTAGDTCAGGTCAGTPYTCDDADACTVDSCNGDGTCTFAPRPFDCDDGEPCTLDTCAPGGLCAHTPTNGDCDDGDACTAGDTCATGVCTGSAFQCDDGNPCTTDTCQGDSGCVATANTLDCDDSSDCTHSDRCLGGACRGTRYSCDDGDVCTSDRCDGGGTCSHTNSTAACNDGSLCTVGDACSGGICRGTAYACENDGNPCTDEVCAGNGACGVVLNTAPCDDGDACTFGDACEEGECAGIPFPCDDGNPCTTDTCQGDGECLAVNNALACDDGDPCTAADTCAAGSCQSTGFACDDADPCTADYCDEAGACGHARDPDCEGPAASPSLRDSSSYSSTRGCGCAVGATAPPGPGWMSLLALALIPIRRGRGRGY